MSKYDEMRKELKHSIIDLNADHYRLDEFMRVIDEIFIKYRNEIEQPKIGGWIPCSERLPEIEQTVLLSLRSLDVSVGFRANTDGYFYTEGEGYVLYENVLAWQPLPEAYHG